MRRYPNCAKNKMVGSKSSYLQVCGDIFLIKINVGGYIAHREGWVLHHWTNSAEHGNSNLSNQEEQGSKLLFKNSVSVTASRFLT